MLIIGCEFHPGFQQVAMFDNQTGEYEEKRLTHAAEAEKRKRWSEAGGTELQKLDLLPYTAERRQQLLRPFDRLQGEIAELNRQVEAEVKRFRQ